MKTQTAVMQIPLFQVYLFLAVVFTTWWLLIHPAFSAEVQSIPMNMSVTYDSGCRESIGGLGFELVATVPATYDLVDDAIAKAAIDQAQSAAFQQCPRLADNQIHRVLTIKLISPRYRNGRAVAVILIIQYLAPNNRSLLGKPLTAEYHNYAAQVAAMQKTQKGNAEKWIIPFMSRHGVYLWIIASDNRGLFDNPFQYKGKTIGFVGTFGGMVSENSAHFFIGRGNGSILAPVVITSVPPTMFKKSGEVVMIAAQMQGQQQLSAMGSNLAVPSLRFVAAEPAPPSGVE